MGIFIAYPWFSIVVAGFFAALWRWRRRWTTFLAALAWAAYGGYEFLMFARVLCSGECNIRVDLLLIFPLLLVVSLVAIIHSCRAGRQTNGRAG